LKVWVSQHFSYVFPSSWFWHKHHNTVHDNCYADRRPNHQSQLFNKSTVKWSYLSDRLIKTTGFVRIFGCHGSLKRFGFIVDFLNGRVMITSYVFIDIILLSNRRRRHNRDRFTTFKRFIRIGQLLFLMHVSRPFPFVTQTQVLFLLPHPELIIRFEELFVLIFYLSKTSCDF
jgi:hypothetical protein